MFKFDKWVEEDENEEEDEDEYKRIINLEYEGNNEYDVNKTILDFRQINITKTKH